MNKIVNVLIGMLLCAVIVSCGDSGDDTNSRGNGWLLGSKWTTTNWDYGVGDDWASVIDETYNIFFYSPTEGMIYYGRKDYDSDFGSSGSRLVAHFNYSVSGNKIELSYITSPMYGFTEIEIQGETLVANGFEFTKGGIASSDNEWLATLHGSTGMCRWYHDLRKTLWIVGEGDMGYYDSYSATPWAMKNRTSNVVIVGKGVTAIGSHAFANGSIAEVSLPSSLFEIGDYAFANSSIGDVDLGDDVRTIGEGAFSGCSYLKQVFLPKNVEIIGDYAFQDCQKLTVALSKCESLQEIGMYAFMGPTVSSFTSSPILSAVGIGAFGNFKGAKLELPNSITRIESLSFNGSFSTVTIGSGVNYVANNAFTSTASSGKLYVNLNIPPTAEGSIISDGIGFGAMEGKWTLYVPENRTFAYVTKSPWNKFKSIIETSSLDGGKDDSGDASVLVDYENLTYTIYGKTYKMVLVDGGNLPPFYIMQTEIVSYSNLQLGDFNGTLDASDDGAVTKSELRKFIDNLRAATGLMFRLPTTAEWQYAAKGGSKSVGYTYSGSNNIDDVAWYKNNSDGDWHNIAVKKPNELGLYDMSGNYGEVCSNSDDNYDVDGPICGGCWDDVASDCKIMSWKNGNKSTNKIPGTNIREKNAFNGKYVTVRLVYSIPK